MNSLTKDSIMKHAIVIGGGMAGLIAAAVAARHFENVTVIDKDLLPDDPQPRKAVPQGNHVHALLKSGEMFLSELFPDFREEALLAGCLEFRVRSQWRTFGPNGWIAPIDIGLTALSQTRPLIEHVVRRLVSRLENVSFITENVVDLQNGENTTNVFVSDGEPLQADLVIDASGRGGGSPGWLASLNGPEVPIDTYRPEIRYASALFSRRIHDGPDYGGWLMFTPAPGRKGAVALPVENDRWLVTVYTRFGDPVPQSEDDFHVFLQNLPDTKIAGLIEGEAAATSISTYAIPKVRFRRFDKVTQEMPDGYIPLGDTIATFSPINAQGMSVAALQAKAMDQALTLHSGEINWRESVPRQYATQASVPTEWAWTLCQAQDAGFDNLRETISAPALDISKIIKLVAENAATHPELIGAMGRAIHLLESPATFTLQVNETLNNQQKI